MDKQLTGVDLIAAERKRQLEVLGYDSTRKEDQHLYMGGELLWAAMQYITGSASNDGSPMYWPRIWQSKFKPSDTITDLTKAGAMIAAEIDRLKALEPEQ